MAISGLSLSKTLDYRSQSNPVVVAAKGDPNADLSEATVFVLGAIDLFVVSAVFDRALEFRRDGGNDVEAAKVKMNEMAVETVRYGLKGWRNMLDSDGAPSPSSPRRGRCWGGPTPSYPTTAYVSFP